MLFIYKTKDKDMAYVLNSSIAEVKEPDLLSLSGNPNFIQFENCNNGFEPEYGRCFLEVLETDLPDPRTRVLIFRSPGLREVIRLKGTYNVEEVNSKTFYIVKPGDLIAKKRLGNDEARNMTAQNIKDCLQKESFFRNNFNIDVSQKVEESLIKIVAKESGSQYFLEVSASDQFVRSTLNDDGSRYVMRFVNSDVPFSLITNNEQSITYHSIKITDEFTDSIMEFWTNGVTSTPSMQGMYSKAPLNPEDKRNSVSESDVVGVYNALNSYPSLTHYFEISRQGDTIELRRKSINFIVEMQSDSRYMVCSREYGNGKKYDSIDGNQGNMHIDLEIYTDTGVFFGEKIKGRSGKYLTTLSKFYWGEPLWFDLNTLLHQRRSYLNHFLELESNGKTWVDAGTMQNYLIMAKRSDRIISEQFYISEALFTINGYNYTLQKEDLKPYIVDVWERHDEDNELPDIVPLTELFDRPHVKGQKHYFNFIFKDNNHNSISRPVVIPALPIFGLSYSLYTQSGKKIEERFDRAYYKQDLYSVNTALINIDRYLPEYGGKTVGRVDVCLYAEYPTSGLRRKISKPLRFRIQPECLHTVSDFAFLNRLGGWDSFGFGGTTSVEFKTTADTVFKTLKPEYTLSDEIESVVAKAPQETFKVQSSLIPYATVEWLRQLSLSPAVYELSTRRYVIVSDLTLKYSSADDLYQVEMKYCYSDTFNGNRK